MLSVIIPTFNEMRLGFLEKTLENLAGFPNVETICVDRQSTDGTPRCILEFGAQLIQTSQNSRAARMNIGIKHSKGTMVLFHHPRSLLDINGIKSLLGRQNELTWGGFVHRFDHSHPLLRFTSWYSNEIRAKGKCILYLDHCIFAQKQFLTQTPPIPEVDIFEDTALSKWLRQFSRPVILPYYSTTSAVRFVQNGVVKQCLVNQALKLGYEFGISPQWMNAKYEKGISLNSQYDRNIKKDSAR